MADDEVPQPPISDHEQHLYRQVNLVTAAILRLAEAGAAMIRDAPEVCARHDLAARIETVAEQFEALEPPLNRLTDEYRHGR